MKIPYISKPNCKNLDIITVKFPNHNRKGVFIEKSFDNFIYNCSLIYRESETSINEVLMKRDSLRYIKNNKIMSPDSPVWCHHKQLEGGIWSSEYNKFKEILDNKL